MARGTKAFLSGIATSLISNSNPMLWRKPALRISKSCAIVKFQSSITGPANTMMSKPS